MNDHERDIVRATCAAAGLTSYSHTGDMEKHRGSVRSLAVLSRGCHSVNPSGSVDVLDAVICPAQVRVDDLDAIPEV